MEPAISSVGTENFEILSDCCLNKSNCKKSNVQNKLSNTNPATEHDKAIGKSMSPSKIINGNITLMKRCSQEFINTNSDILNETAKGILNVAMKAPMSKRLAGVNDEINQNLMTMKNNLTVLMNGINNDINNITKFVTLNEKDKENMNPFSRENLGYARHIQDDSKYEIDLRGEESFRTFDWSDKQKERKMDQLTTTDSPVSDSFNLSPYESKISRPKEIFEPLSTMGKISLYIRYLPNSGKIILKILKVFDMPNLNRGGTKTIQVHLCLLPEKKQRYRSTAVPYTSNITELNYSYEFREGNIIDINIFIIRIRVYSVKPTRKTVFGETRIPLRELSMWSDGFEFLQDLLPRGIVVRLRFVYDSL